MEKDRKQSIKKSSIFYKLKSLAIFKTKRRKTATLLVVFVLAFLGWQMFKGNTKPVQYQTAKAERGTLVSSISASGQVSFVNNENVTTSATGIIKTVFVKTGDLIDKGQPIAEIDLDLAGLERQSLAWSNYLSAKNTLDSANAKVNSLQSALFKANQTFVNDRGTINPITDDPKYIEEKADWLQAEANYINQQSVIEQAQIAFNSAWLAYLQTSATIIAPISGTVDLSIDVGAAISGSNSTTPTSQKIAGIKTNNKPAIIVSLSEIDVPKVKLGNKATLTFDAIPGKTFTGKIVGIDTLGIVTSGVTNYPIILAMDTQAPNIFPNMSVSANIIIARKSDVLIIPLSAIQTQGDQSYVRILKNGKAQEVLVETGISSDTEMEITSGLAKGDEVITGTISFQSGQQSASPFGVRFGGVGGSTRGGR